ERESTAQEHLAFVAKTTADERREKRVNDREPGEIRRIFRERSSARWRAAAKDARRVEVRIAWLGVLFFRQIPINIEEARAIFRHSDDVDAHSKSSKTRDRHRVVIELGEDGESFLCSRRSRSSRTKERHLFLRRTVQRRERVRFD